MVAPIDAKVTMEVEGEKITLRLNMRAIALAEEQGIDMFDDKALNRLTTLGFANLFLCLAREEQAEFKLDHALAVTLRHGDACIAAFRSLMNLAAGKGGDEGNGPKPE